jgi:hypothetical protein
VAIGRIKSISVEDGQLVAIVENGAGPAVTVTAMFPPGFEGYPIRGDMVKYHKAGQEYVATAFFTEDSQTSPGDAFMFSRNPQTGAVSAIVKALSAGGIEIVLATGQAVSVGNGSDFVALATKVDASISAISNAISNASTGSSDGGAALKANIISILTPALQAIGSVASANVKAD